jgi:hypothetical protein
MAWTKESTRGRHNLIAFNIGYDALGRVCERFNRQGHKLSRKVAAGLVEIYLYEVGESYTPKLLRNPDKFARYVNDPKAKVLELNPEGFAIVRAFIVQMRKRIERIANSREDEGKRWHEPGRQFIK